MDVMPVSYIPGDPMLIDNIVWELKSQGIFDTFRKECIADVDTKPAYQNLRQRVEGSVASFLRKQTWSPDLNKNQLREQLRKNIYESGYLETGVERIVDQVVNPKMNTVFLPKVTEVVYKYLGLAKPEIKSEKEKEEELKIKTEELLPKELEAVSPESRHDDKNEDSNLSLESMKIDEDESPPFEPLDEDNSVDSHMSGISGLQSHDSNSSPKNLQIDVNDTQTSKHSSDGGAAMELDEQPTQDASKGFEGDSNSNSSKSDLKKDNDRTKDKPKSDSNKARSRSESKSDKNDRKHDRSKDKDKYRDKEREHKDKYRDKDKSKGDKDKDKHRTDRKKDDRRDKDKSCSGTTSNSKRDSYKSSSSKSKDDKARSKHDSSRDRKTSSSRSDKDKDKEKDKDRKYKDRKDDHYSAKHKNERRSTDRDSNDGSGLKSSSSSYCESNSSSQHSHKESTNSNDSNQGGNSDKNNENKHKSNYPKETKPASMKKKTRDSKGSVVLDSEVDQQNEIEIRPKTPPPSISVSAASWDALEAQLNSNVSYDTYYDSDHEVSDKMVEPLHIQEVQEVQKVQKVQDVQEVYDQSPSDSLNDEDVTQVQQNAESPEAVSVSDDDSINKVSLKYFSQSSIEIDECNLKKATKCLAKLEKQIQDVETCLFNSSHDGSGQALKRRNDEATESPLKKIRNSNVVGNLPLPITNDSQNLPFHLPLSPAESDSDKSTDKKADDVLPTPEPKRRVVHASQRYSSDDLYKPRPVIKRSTSRRRGNIDT